MEQKEKDLIYIAKVSREGGKLQVAYEVSGTREDVMMGLVTQLDATMNVFVRNGDSEADALKLVSAACLTAIKGRGELIGASINNDSSKLN